MEDKNDQLKEGLTSLENRTGLESSIDEMNSDQEKKMKLTSVLKMFQPPPRDPEKVALQLDSVLDAANKRQIDKKNTKQEKFQKNKPRWLYPLAATTGTLSLLVICVAFIALTLGITSGITWYLNRPFEGQAVIQDTQGVLEVQENDGGWVVVDPKVQLKTGAHLRTRYLSSASIQLADGSTIHMGPLTEIILEQMEMSLLSTRVVRITQWSGATEHDVASSNRKGALYEVQTPAAAVAAVSTKFTVQIDQHMGTSIEVKEGFVEVSGSGTTKTVDPGWTTTVAYNQPPTEPALLVSGEGVLLGTPGAWTIAGLTVTLGADTQADDDVQAGDQVSFSGHQLADGAIQVDRLEVLMPLSTQEFSLTSPVEAFASNALVAAETVIAINEYTFMSTSYDSGDVTTIEGVIQPDETWLAERVYGQVADQFFEFTGVVESIDEVQWIISGVEIQVDGNTVVPAGILVGDLVQVQGWIQENGDWLAAQILPVLPEVTYFDFTGVVENTDPWVVAGITLDTRLWTAVDPGIEHGDEVRVRGPILADGTWVAASIEKTVPPFKEITLEFVGTVNNIEPWVISGIVLVVDEQTNITGDVQIGSLVSVHSTRKNDGSWHADQITLVSPGQAGCVTYAAVITSIDANTITLLDGRTIDLAEVELIEGEIKVDSTILVVQCQEADGEIIYPLIKVLDIPPVLQTSTPTATATPAPKSIILPNCYQITFLEFTEHEDGTSTWRYRVEELSCAMDLSNWVLELPVCARVIDAAPSPWEVVNPDPNIHLNGIKWEVGEDFEQGVFSVVLSGSLVQGSTYVGATGPDVAVGVVIGPDCSFATTTPTITPTGSTTPTVTETSTITPTFTNTPTPTVTEYSPPVSGLIVITDNAQSLTINCNGAVVEVRGNANNITLLGSCSSLTIYGNGNWISVQSSPSLVIVDKGNANTVIQR
jgi:hypothetical protein